MGFIWKRWFGTRGESAEPLLFEDEITGIDGNVDASWPEDLTGSESDHDDPEGSFALEEPLVSARSRWSFKSFGLSGLKRRKARTVWAKNGTYRPVRREKIQVRNDADFLTEVFIQVEVENGRLLFWHITQDQVRVVEEEDIPENSPVITFTQQDYRLLVKTGVSTQQAKSLAHREMASMEKVRVVNLSRRLGVIYATGISRLMPTTLQLIPGMACLDRLVQEAKIQLPVAAGFHLGTPDGTNLLILHAVKPGVNKAELLVSINPSNLEELLKKFISKHKLQGRCLYNSEALLVHAVALSPYPGSPEWNGIDSVRIYHYAAMVAGVAACISLTWSVIPLVRIHAARTSIHNLQISINQEQALIGQRIAQHPTAFAQLVSLQEENIFRQAEAIWHPGSSVSVKATPQSDLFSLSFPMVNSAWFESGKPSVFSVASSSEVLSILKLHPPMGCKKSGLFTTGELNEIDLELRCTVPHSGLDALVGS